MLIHQQIKQDRLQALRDKDSVTKRITMYLLGEADTAIKDGRVDPVEVDGKFYATDKYMEDVIKKARKSALSNLRDTEGDDALSDVDFESNESDNQYLQEVAVYHRYIPTMLSHKQTAQLIDHIFETQEVKNAGVVIGRLKKDHGDTIDGSFVAKYTKEKM